MEVDYSMCTNKTISVERVSGCPNLHRFSKIKKKKNVKNNITPMQRKNLTLANHRVFLIAKENF
jgi:hypothetical protein